MPQWNRIIIGLLALLWITVPASLSAQVALDPASRLDQYSIIYISDLIENPENAPILFEYILEPTEANPEIAIEAEMSADIPDLGLQNERIFKILTDSFTLTGSITISNRNLAEGSQTVVTTAGQPITITASSGNVELLSGRNRDQLMSEILSVPALPAGVYMFRFSVLSSAGGVIASDQQTIEVSSNPTVNLIDPRDAGNVASIYPLFKWNSTGSTRNCTFGIRISEYNPNQHSSLEGALNDVSVFPYPDNGGFVELDPDDPSDFEYVSTESGAYHFRYDPTKGGRDLQEGHQYVWEVKKYCQTTSGVESVESEIYQFTVGMGASDPVKTALESILGEERYDAYFNVGGKLVGYSANPGGITIDGEIIEMTRLLKLSRAFENGKYSVQSIQLVE